MSRAVCRIVLSEGAWKTRPCGRAVRDVLRSIFPRHADAEAPRPPALVRLGFEEPEEDEVLAAKAVVRTGHCHAEIIRDRIVEALAGCFQPYYESMIEVEALDE